MRCPRCDDDGSRVVDSRPNPEANRIRRRRECPACSHRWSTLEVVERHPVKVLKKDGRREILDREKLLRGIERACEKRPIPYHQLEATADEIMGALTRDDPREILVADIGEQVLLRLKALDPIAYVRFMSVYRDFRTAQEFLDELGRLVHGGGLEAGGAA